MQQYSIEVNVFGRTFPSCSSAVKFLQRISESVQKRSNEANSQRRVLEGIVADCELSDIVNILSEREVARRNLQEAIDLLQKSNIVVPKSLLNQLDKF